MHESIIDCVGNTPLVKLNQIATGLNATIAVKLESANPCGSVKDRIAAGMVEAAERDGTLKPGGLLIEPTSGNTGIGLAFVAAAKGYKLMLTMPDTMSMERRNLLLALGAELVLTPGKKGMTGAINEAKRLITETPGAIMLGQFDNPANPETHRNTTAVEIWDQTDGAIDFFVAGVGTGGTFTGVSSMLKSKKSSVKAIAVEPFTSAVLSGESPSSHKIQGIGAGFIPENMDQDLVDEVLKVSDKEAMDTARELARKEGILCGISAGANVFSAIQLAKRPENAGKLIVTVICDTGERYLSTDLFNQS